MKANYRSKVHVCRGFLKNLPEADMFIHGGDISKIGTDHEVEDFIHWFSRLNYKYKVFIAGNHDFYLEDESIHRVQKDLPPNAYYLCNSGITIEGLNIWGSPVSPTYNNWIDFFL